MTASGQVASSRALYAMAAFLSFVQAYNKLEEGGLQFKLLAGLSCDYDS